MTIRNERPEDFRAVEELTKKAFWNVNVPGCSEHYLVHILRSHADFVSELDFVAEFDGKKIANIMFTRSRLRGEDGTEKRGADVRTAERSARVSAARLWQSAAGVRARQGSGYGL